MIAKITVEVVEKDTELHTTSKKTFRITDIGSPIKRAEALDNIDEWLIDIDKERSK